MAKYVIQLTGGITWWVSEASNATILQIFRCLNIIASTSKWPNPQEIDLTTDDGHKTDETQQSESAALPEQDLIVGQLSHTCQYTLDI